MGDDRPDALADGTMVGAYRIAYRIGGGGMGTVYAAEEPTIRKRVAVKVLRYALADDAGAAARLEREARAANDVRHPAIVDVFAFGKLPDGRPYLVMSFLEGRSLRDELARRGKLPAAEAWAIVREIGEALVAAHAAGIVHRDIKPDNLFLERFGDKPARPRLLDLGLAKVALDPDDDGPSPAKLTRTGTPLGTPAYMAPEQWWGTEVDGRADQYALGLTLFELLAGRPPFTSQQFMELAQQHTSVPAPSLASVGCDASDAVEALVARALAKTPAERFESMAELVAAGDRAFGAPVASAAATSPGSASAASAATAPSGHADTVAVASGMSARSSEIAAGVAALSAGDPKAAPSTTAEPELDPRARLSRFRAACGLVLVGGAATLVGVGYAGESRRDVGDWLYAMGPPRWPILAALVAGGVAVVAGAPRRARGGAPSLLPWIAAVAAALSATGGAWLGWNMVASGVERFEGVTRFDVLHRGMFEVGLSRFLGFYVATLLVAAAALAPGLAPSGVWSAGPRAALPPARLLSAALGLAAIGALGAAIGAPSGALVGGVAAAVVALGAVLPLQSRATGARDEAERAAAELLATSFAFAVGLARVEAREAALWGESPTRASRVAEVIAAAAERRATLLVGGAVAVALVALQVVRLRVALRAVARPRPGAAAWALAAAVVVVGGAEVAQRMRSAATRDRVHAELEPQFALFARLDPPTAGDLDGKRWAPHRAPALQIARNVVAVNGRPVAPLSAAESPDGAANIGRDLSHALAEHGAREGAGDVDLAISIDRQVPWSAVATLLGVAHRAGARRLELLLTRGPAPSLPVGAPPEATWLLASDFVAIRAVVTEDGFSAAAGEPFGAVAAALVRRAQSADEPVRLSSR